MAYPEDPDFSGVDALPDPAASPKLSTELDSLATAIQATATGVNGDAGGKTPDEVVAAANAAATATRDQANNAAVAEAAIKILKDAVAAWKKDAPKKVELDAAEKRLTEAGTALAAVQKAYDDAKDDTAKALVKPVLDSAVAEQQAALLNLQTLKNKRKAADAAYERERLRAAKKMDELTASNSSGEAPATGSGTGTPSTSTGTSTQSASTGNPAARTPSGTPKPTGSTPAAQTPSSQTPAKEKGTSTSDLATLLAAAQQQNQQPQQAAATPQASTPQQPQTGQNRGDKDKGTGDPNKKTTDAIDVDDLIREGALPASAAAATFTGVGAGNPSPSPAPAASTPSTTFRPAGTPLPGVGLGGAPAVNQQNPVTSGTSATGLHTASDVSGRSTPAASAFSPTPSGAETKTSGAAGNAAQQGTPLTQRGAGTGMPAMPMVPPMGGAAGGGGGGGRGGGGGAEQDPPAPVRRAEAAQR